MKYLKSFNENLGFDLIPQQYEIRFKKDTIVFTTFIGVECGKKIYGEQRGHFPNTSIIKDGIRDVDMEILMEENDKMMINVDMVHAEEDIVDISGFSLCNTLQYQEYHYELDIEEYSMSIKSSTCGIILDPLTKNGSMMSLSMNDVEIKGIHY